MELSCRWPNNAYPAKSEYEMASALPVVLVPGFATSAARTWGENAWYDLLADCGRQSFPLDVMGSGTAPKPHDPAAYANVEEDLFSRMPDGPVDAIGFSLGARLLLQLACEHPNKFNSLIVAGVGRNLFERDGTSEQIAAAIDGTAPTTDPLARYFVQLAEAPDQDREALAAFMRRPNPPALTPEMLSAITCPVLVVLGDKDFAGPADPLCEALSNCQLVTLRGVDHFATPKDFGFIDAALQFLS
jgi:pimeloyl-ACP methyl ester carboxylesterase